MFISLCQCIVNLIMAKKYYAYNIVSFLKESLAPCIVVATIISLSLWVLTIVINTSIWRVLLAGMVGFGLCLLLGYFFVFNSYERTKILSFAKNTIKNK